jgi:hypothetical protein
MRTLIGFAAAGLAAVSLGVWRTIHRIHNGNIFDLSAYCDGFYLGHSQSSPFRIPARPTNRPSDTDIHRGEAGVTNPPFRRT